MRISSLLSILLVAFSLSWGQVSAEEETSHGVKVVVLDPGHGGWDPGAVRGSLREKDITLRVVLRLGALIEKHMPGVEVKYTRKTDKALGPDKRTDLRARTKMANDVKGDLLISVHVNAARSSAAYGVETLVMGETPLEQNNNRKVLMESNREDLFDMSDEKTAAMVRAYIQNLQFSYGEYSLTMAHCIQNSYKKSNRHVRKIKKQPLMVLYATNMPGVLTEIGFLSNPKEAAYMRSEKGVNEIAQSLLRAIQEYSSKVAAMRLDVEEDEDGNREECDETEKGNQPISKPEVQKERKPSVNSEQKHTQKQSVEKTAPIRYTVQVVASKSRLSLSSSRFKSYRNKVKQYTGRGSFRYKYCVGEFRTLSEAKNKCREVRKQFSDAFVVRCRGSQIVY